MESSSILIIAPPPPIDYDDEIINKPVLSDQDAEKTIDTLEELKFPTVQYCPTPISAAIIDPVCSSIVPATIKTRSHSIFKTPANIQPKLKPTKSLVVDRIKSLNKRDTIAFSIAVVIIIITFLLGVALPIIGATSSKFPNTDEKLDIKYETVDAGLIVTHVFFYLFPIIASALLISTVFNKRRLTKSLLILFYILTGIMWIVYACIAAFSKEITGLKTIYSAEMTTKLIQDFENLVPTYTHGFHAYHYKTVTTTYYSDGKKKKRTRRIKITDELKTEVITASSYENDVRLGNIAGLDSVQIIVLPQFNWSDESLRKIEEQRLKDESECKSKYPYSNCSITSERDYETPVKRLFIIGKNASPNLGISPALGAAAMWQGLYYCLFISKVAPVGNLYVNKNNINF